MQLKGIFLLFQSILVTSAGPKLWNERPCSIEIVLLQTFSRNSSKFFSRLGISVTTGNISKKYCPSSGNFYSRQLMDTFS